MNATIEKIYSRIEEDGDCWEWKGAFQSCGATPMIHWGNKVIAVRRLVAIEMGKNVTGKVVTCSCRNELCVNPDHIMVVTRKQLQVILAKERTYHTSPVRRMRISQIAREKLAKITYEQAMQIRQAEGTQRAIAAMFGVSQATVNKIKLGVTWQDYTNPFVQLLGIKK